MQRLNSCLLFAWLVLSQYINARTSLIQDTIYVQKNISIYELKENFLIPNTCIATINNTVIKYDSLGYLDGIIYWNNNYESPTTVILKYEILSSDIPISVGPKWKLLPIVSLDDSTNHDSVNPYMNNNYKVPSSIYTSGSFNRQINVSTQGMSELSGGLNLNITGQLDDNTMISAILNDQNMNLNPEGDTRNLDDLDQVYISLLHPNFSLKAGDIIYKNNIDKLINIERNVIGLNNSFRYKNSSGDALIASTKGKYNYIELKGIDGVQGPYNLTSLQEGKDISLISGSEKVWLDGELMIRGSNYDYIIDYSSSQLTFMPKRLIHFDSDILIEYEFIDGQYAQDIISGTYNFNFSNKANITSGFYREKDNTSTIDTDYNLESNDKELYINGAIEDSSGDYYYKNNIYIYDPNNESSQEKRYRVTFSYNQNGTYIRKVDNTGQVYYEYFSNNNDNDENIYLYSPFQLINTPSLSEVFFSKAIYNIGNNFNFSALIGYSNHKSNTFSNIHDNSRGNLYDFGFDIDSLEIGKYNFSISGSNLIREKNYRSFSNDRDIRFKRFWGIDSLFLSNEKESSINFLIGNKSKSISNIELSSLEINKTNNSRLVFSHSVFNGLMKGSNFIHRKVSNSFGDYKYYNSILSLDYRGINPFLNFQKEETISLSDYNILGGGIKYDGINNSISFSLNKRENIVSGQKNSEDLITSIEYLIKGANGWKNNLTLNHRSKTYFKSSQSLRYLLGKVKISYRKEGSPFEYDMNTSSERKLSETYSVVYDSIGPGLGNYRYDKTFNTYIEDPNGQYISYNIFSGSKDEITNINGSQRIMYDFFKGNRNINLKFRLETIFDYGGRSFLINTLLNPKINDTSLFRSYIQNFIDFDFRFTKSKDRLRIYNSYSHDLKGYDPRGNELSNISKSGFDYMTGLNNLNILKLEVYTHIKEVLSGFSISRDRKVNGSWYKIGLLTESISIVESEISIKYGYDRGSYYQNNFNASGYGINYDGRIFLKGGSFHASVSWEENKEKSNISILPPEALNGFSIGKNLRTSMRINYLFNKTISLSLSVNHINNQRYNNITSFLGEFRAYL